MVNEYIKLLNHCIGITLKKLCYNYIISKEFNKDEITFIYLIDLYDFEKYKKINNQIIYWMRYL